MAQIPLLALINPFLIIPLAQGGTDLGEPCPHPSLPRGRLGALLTEVGGSPTRPPSVVGERAVKSPGLNTVMKAGDGGGRGFRSNKLLALCFQCPWGPGGRGRAWPPGPSLPLLADLVLYEAVLARLEVCVREAVRLHQQLLVLGGRRRGLVPRAPGTPIPVNF